MASCVYAMDVQLLVICQALCQAWEHSKVSVLTEHAFRWRGRREGINKGQVDMQCAQQRPYCPEK